MGKSTTINTYDFIEDITFDSIYDGRYRDIPDEERKITYKRIIVILNSLIEEIAYKQPFSIKESHKATVNDDGYGKIETNFVNIEKVEYILSANCVHSLEFQELEEFTSLAQNRGMKSTPVYWTYYEAQREVWVYPMPNGSNKFNIYGKKFLEAFEYQYIKGGENAKAAHIFSPQEIKVNHNLQYLTYLQVCAAERLAGRSNTPFSEERRKIIKDIEKSLFRNKKVNLRSHFKPTMISTGGYFDDFNYISRW